VVVRELCKSIFCHTSYTKYDGYCWWCHIHLFPDKPAFRNYKTKELLVKNFILDNFPDKTWICDKKVQDGCSEKRPDLLLDLGYQIIIIEVDEKQHSIYESYCENKRMMILS
jgi:hypothetical protein